MGFLDDAKAVFNPSMSAAPETADPCEPLKEESERILKMKDGPEVPGDFDMILQNAEGEKKQILYLLQIMNQRLETLKLQREELELAVVDIESVCERAQATLAELEAAENS